MHKPLLFIISLVFISGCASTVGPSSLPGPTQWQNKSAACMAATKQSDWVMMEVPAARNAISNKIAALTMNMGGSNAVEALVKVLSQPARPAIAIFGESDEMTAATLETALHKLPPGANRSREPLCFVGDPQYGAQLKLAAESAGLHFVMIPNP